MERVSVATGAAVGSPIEDRPLHVLCAYTKDEETAIIITTYQPDPDRWIGFERRKK